eukprot:3963868-Amphidinium_carterae.1
MLCQRSTLSQLQSARTLAKVVDDSWRSRAWVLKGRLALTNKKTNYTEDKTSRGAKANHAAETGELHVCAQEVSNLMAVLTVSRWSSLQEDLAMQ